MRRLLCVAALVMPASVGMEAVDTGRPLSMPVSPLSELPRSLPLTSQKERWLKSGMWRRGYTISSGFTVEQLVGVAISHAPHRHKCRLSRAEVRDVILCNPLSGDDKPHGSLRISG